MSDAATTHQENTRPSTTGPSPIRSSARSNRVRTGTSAIPTTSCSSWPARPRRRLTRKARPRRPSHRGRGAARTALEKSIPTTFPPQTLSEFNTDNARLIDGYRQLANVVLFTSLPIAGCSLAVSVAGGVSERRRPFSLLRLTGVPLAMLRRVVTLEAAVPLLISVVVSVGAGLAAAALFLRAQLDQTLQPPNASYYVLVIGGVVASLLIIASTLPLLACITAPRPPATSDP